MLKVSSWPPALGTPERRLIEELAHSAAEDQLRVFGIEFFQLCTGIDVTTSLRTLLDWKQQGFITVTVQVHCTKCLSIYPQFLAEIDDDRELDCPYCWDDSTGEPTVFTPTPEDTYLLFGFTMEGMRGIIEAKQTSSPTIQVTGTHYEPKPLNEAELLATLEAAIEEAREHRDIRRMAEVVGIMERIETCDARSRAAQFRSRYPHLNTML